MSNWLNVSSIEIKNARNEYLIPNYDKLTKDIFGDTPVDKSIISTIFDTSLCRVLLSFELHGTPPEIGNSLVRVATTEQIGVALDVKYESINTDDNSIEINSLIDNIKHLPLRYGLTTGEIESISLHLNLKNTEFSVIPVMSGDIKIRGINGYKVENPIMYSNIQLTSLSGGKSLQIDHIEIMRGTGFAPGSSNETAKYYPAHAYSIIPLDRKKDDIPKNFSYSDTTPNSTPLIHKIRCELGCVLPKTKGLLNVLFYNGCISLVERLNIIKYIVTNKTAAYYSENSERCVLQIPETNSLAKIIDRVAISLHPKLLAITAESRYPDEIMKVIIDDPKNREILLSTIDKCIEIYTHLSAIFSKLDVEYI